MKTHEVSPSTSSLSRCNLRDESACGSNLRRKRFEAHSRFRLALFETLPKPDAVVDFRLVVREVASRLRLILRRNEDNVSHEKVKSCYGFLLCGNFINGAMSGSITRFKDFCGFRE